MNPFKERTDNLISSAETKLPIPESWSETVDELMDVTFMRPLRRRQPNSIRARRSALAFMGVDNTASSTDDVSGEPPFRADDEEEWPDCAINVVRFIVGHDPEG